MNCDVLYWIWLAECFSYGSVKPFEILKKYQSAKNFYNRRREAVQKLSLLDLIEKKRVASTWAQSYLPILEQCMRNKIQICCYEDEDYPARLKGIDCPPMVFYYLGDLSILARRCVAMVGTRNANEASCNTAFRLASELAEYGIIVVSGCAGGIDTSVHRGAMECGKTASILGTALNENYPSFNASLKRAIVKRGGLIMSEYPWGTKTHRGMFPIRNRLISGVSDAVIVVEAPRKSGALITAHNAVEQGKEVFCISPADIYNKRYDGARDLLRECAKPVMGVQDILEMYRYHSGYEKKIRLPERRTTGRGTAHQSADNAAESSEQMCLEQTACCPEGSFACADASLKEDLSAHSAVILQLIKKQSMTIELLAQNTGLELPVLLAALTELEVDGSVQKKGGYYCRRADKL